MDPVSGILNKLIVATPFVLVTTLGLHARTNHSEFQFEAYSPEQNRRVENYRPVAAATEAAYADGSLMNEATALRVAHQWIAGARSGLLKPLAPIAIDDFSHEGVKAEILKDCDEVAEALNLAAMEREREHDPRTAIVDALTAAEAIQTVRFFDFSSVALTSLQQKKALTIAMDALSKLPARNRAEFGAKVLSFRATESRLNQLTLGVRQLVQQEDGEHAAVDKYLTFKRARSEQDLIQLRHTAPNVPSTDTGMIDLVNEYRLGMVAADDANREIARFRSSDPKSNPAVTKKA